MKDTKRSIQEARDKGVTVVGVYFEEGEVDEENSYFPDMYGNKDYVLCSTDQIEKNLSVILERFFKGD